MTLDLEDCVLTGSAITQPFLRDGLAQMLDLRQGIDDGWDALRQSLRGGGTQRVHQYVTTRLASIDAESSIGRKLTVT